MAAGLGPRHAAHLFALLVRGKLADASDDEIAFQLGQLLGVLPLHKVAAVRFPTLARIAASRIERGR